MNVFDDRLAECGAGALTAAAVEILQVNVGLRCNQACGHCHLHASPAREEVMPDGVMDLVLRAAATTRPGLVDITGGAPELHPRIREFVSVLTGNGLAVQVRTNLTVLLEPGCDDLPAFFHARGVRLVGSMPCYLEENVDRQRGQGVYRRSLAALRLLNDLGYGTSPAHPLDLVHNPGGAGLPAGQSGLQEDYRRELNARQGIVFTNLLTITNQPLGRFGELLRRDGGDLRYLELLRARFNPATVAGLMCRRQVAVGWDGRIYDCDFNLALGLPVRCGASDHISRFAAAELAGRRIATGPHCFGCTAGAGSSCRGALSAA